MPTDAKKPTSEPGVPSKNTALFVFGTIADTTWRLFTPVLVGVIGGIWIDKTYDIVPFATIAGTALGAIGSGGLVYQQIKREIK